MLPITAAWEPPPGVMVYMPRSWASACRGEWIWPGPTMATMCFSSHSNERMRDRSMDTWKGTLPPQCTPQKAPMGV